MADYKRFVSYMYEYENGVKKRNVGYARVEIRNGECKFTIYMQIDGLKEGLFPTYLIHRPTDEMELVYLGDCIVKNQIMDSKLTAKESNVMDSGYKFSEMGGILLFLNSEVFYATQWDDKPVVLNEVLEALKPKPKDRLISSKLNDKEEEKVSENQDVKISQEKASETEVPEETVYIKGRSPNEEAENTDSKVTEDKLENAKVAETDEKQIIVEETPYEKPVYTEEGTYGKKAVYVEEETPEAKAVYAEKGTPEEKKTPDDKISDSITMSREETTTYTKKDAFDNLAAAYTSYSSENKADEQTEKNKDSTENQVPLYKLPRGWKTKEAFRTVNSQPPINPWELVDKYRSQAESKKAPDLSTNNMRKPGETQENNPLIDKIFSHYPRIYPFEDNEIKRCVKIEPKDIGVLPSDIWSLSNNSFLLHGYYCYHHLIFAEIIDRYGSHYILGVPGIYHNRERFMARMFGFECFKSIRKREPKLGDFGYWYIEIKF